MSTKSRRLGFAPHLAREIAAPRVRSMAQTAGLAAIAAMVMWLAACGKDGNKAAKKTEAPALEAKQVEAKQVEANPPEAAPPEAARPPEERPKVVKLTGERQFMFHADTGEATEFDWTHEGKQVHFSLLTSWSAIRS